MSTLKKYQAMVSDTLNRPITEQEITSACSALRNGTEAVRCLLEENMLYDGYRSRVITEAQETKGLAWIKANRNRKVLACFTQNEWNVVDSFDVFMFMGFLAGDGYPGIYPTFDRVYRVYATNGSWFDYTCVVGKIRVINSSPNVVNV